jgi:DNA (cytosine-5)-methyltransferase 1
MRIGSLFAGIGGLELGLEAAGLGTTIWQCEIDPFCRRVLARHWPMAERYEDITTISVFPKVDIMCGGFPCQDVSSAGKQAGLSGARSGLWFEFRRCIREGRPSYVIIENVRSGAKLWLPTVRQDLHVLGYRSRALGVSAFDVGAPHIRKRVFVLAYTDSKGKSAIPVNAKMAGASTVVPHTDATRQSRLSRREAKEYAGSCQPIEYHNGDHWKGTQPAMVRVADGVSTRLDACRRRALGNAVVPQCSYVVGLVLRKMIDDGL